MSKDKQQILAVYQRIDDAMVNKDTETISQIGRKISRGAGLATSIKK